MGIVAPNSDLNIRIVNEPQREIVLTADAGDLACWVHLAVEPLPPDTSFHASLSNGTTLDVVAVPVAGALWALDLRKAGSSTAEKFDWPAGVAIRVRAVPPAGRHPTVPLSVKDWAVFPKDKESDAAWKAHTRRVSLLFVVFFFGLSVLGVAVREAWPETRAAELFSSQTCVTGIIGSLEGRNSTDTARLRRLLTKVLIEGASLDEALSATGLPRYEAIGVWFRTRAMFRARLDRLLQVLLQVKRDVE